MRTTEIDLKIQKLNELKEAKPFITTNGKDIYDFQTATLLKEAEIEKQNKYKPREIQNRKLDDRGGYVKSYNPNKPMIDPSILFRNKSRVVDIKGVKYNDVVFAIEELHALKQQASGNIGKKQVMSYRFAKKGEKGKETIYLKEIVYITDTEFVNEFKSILNNETISNLFKIIAEDAEKESNTVVGGLEW